MSGITTHVLDTARGRPAAGVPVVLERFQDDATWRRCGSSVTDADGRARKLTDDALVEGTYRLTFDTGAYYPDGFYPHVTICFVVRDAAQHHHVPLLLSPFGYSTYRGS